MGEDCLKPIFGIWMTGEFCLTMSLSSTAKRALLMCMLITRMMGAVNIAKTMTMVPRPAVSLHLLLHMKTGQVVWDPEHPGGYAAQESSLPQPVPPHKAVPEKLSGRPRDATFLLARIFYNIILSKFR